MIKIFTDGSYIPETDVGAYCAVIINDAQPSITDSECMIMGTIITGVVQGTTSHRMEITAIMKAVEKLNTLYGNKKHEIEIYTDAESVISSVNRYFQQGKKPRRHLALWNELYAVLQQHSVRFVFVSASNRQYPEHGLCHKIAKSKAKSVRIAGKENKDGCKNTIQN